jgi:hypothetical protein
MKPSVWLAAASRFDLHQSALILLIERWRGVATHAQALALSLLLLVSERPIFGALCGARGAWCGALSL